MTGISLLVILSFSVFAISQPDDAKAEFVSWKNWIGVSFTWLYIGAMVSWQVSDRVSLIKKTPQKFWILFVLVIYLSKYSDIKIGPEDSKPEYNDATW